MGVAFAAVLQLVAMTPSNVAWWFRGAGFVCSYIVFLASLSTSVRVLLYGIPSTKVVRFYNKIIFVVAFLAATAAFVACFILEGSLQYLPKACNCTLIQAGKGMGDLNDSAAPAPGGPPSKSMDLPKVVNYSCTKLENGTGNFTPSSAAPYRTGRIY